MRLCEGVLTLSDCFPTGSAGKWEVYPEGPRGGGTVIENRFSPMVDNGSQQKMMLGKRKKKKQHIIRRPEQGRLHPALKRRGRRERVTGEF
ncbi:hypothetical protein QQF64_033436 [Cirrhinus molitorella]|uniref:Uncharacterized protein n=1 Tax=Cirrhinus molitorella TaxID=172907 RepID=A0ABR3MTU8_9TELE